MASCPTSLPTQPFRPRGTDQSTRGANPPQDQDRAGVPGRQTWHLRPERQTYPSMSTDLASINQSLTYSGQYRLNTLRVRHVPVATISHRHGGPAASRPASHAAPTATQSASSDSGSDAGCGAADGRACSAIAAARAAISHAQAATTATAPSPRIRSQGEAAPGPPHQPGSAGGEAGRAPTRPVAPVG
jgi:hypothetical protein